ncbi:phytoene/squalene synthase family protein [Kaistia algarum]|uniref:phytoene/squalene synthase family protein n=1 Tax=Kaistia algarum TaxID=2083279 RepID=UPI000CE82386|nr:phytoene/squalene synthase family protein [Kaistia algarum]MCX5515120.1 phytoene/squalene synthase family protein [Kaistia algarum]PPE79844.1 phytoene/squalene synthase family protein [Kaistia algarum]
MDVFAHCAAEVRQHDRERFLADLFAPEAPRRHLFALHAFNLEIARVRELVSEPMPGEIRLQWWRDLLTGQATGDAAGHPVAAAVLETLSLNGLPADALDRLIEARIFDLYNDPMPSLADLEGYAGETSSVLVQYGAMILAGGRDPGTADAAGHSGVALAITGLLRALPIHARRRQLYLPADLLQAEGVVSEDIFAGRTTPELLRLLKTMRDIAQDHLGRARAALASAETAVLPAFLPLALVEPVLARMERPDYAPLATTVDLAPWRSQWMLWRAARRGRV